jgi:hypothetical protein
LQKELIGLVAVPATQTLMVIIVHKLSSRTIMLPKCAPFDGAPEHTAMTHLQSKVFEIILNETPTE